jgi:MFS transporter, OFA family, oxalate/formate antiporter
LKPSRDSRIFYGWYIVAIAFVANFMSLGTSFYIVNAFMEPVCRGRGWTRTDINIALSLGTIFGILSQLLYGTLVIRIGPRILMLLGSLFAGISFILLGQAKELWHFSLFYIFLFCCNGAYGGIVANTAVSNWFVRKKGKAMGLAATGQSLSGVILPFTAMMIISRSRLESAFFWIGLAIMSVGPLAWLVVRDWPESHGLVPDGIRTTDAQRSSLKGLRDPRGSRCNGSSNSANLCVGQISPWTLSVLLRTPTFWKLGMAYGLAIMGVVGVMSQLKPRFTDIGFSDLAAMGMMSATAFAGTIGKYIWGRLCDHLDPIRVVTALLILNGLSLALVFFPRSPIALILFIVLFGFAMGGVWSTYPVVVAELFGRKSFASVSRFVTVFFLLEVAGYLIAGRSFDRTGSYDSAYTLFIALYFVSAFLLSSARRPIA